MLGDPGPVEPGQGQTPRTITFDHPDEPSHDHDRTTTTSLPLGHGRIRWAILGASCMVMLGNYYSFDNPAALNQPLQEYMGMSDDTYAYFLNILYTSYSMPNIILPWLGGYASDKFGHRNLLLSLSAMVAMGHLVVCLGLERKNVAVMIFGRVLFGAGESLAVAQSAITVKYFRGKELAMALGINLCVARLGSVLNDIVTPYIWARSSVPAAFWGGFVSCILSFLTACLLVWMDERFGPQMGAGFSRLPSGPDARYSLEMANSPREGRSSTSSGRTAVTEVGAASSLSLYDPPTASMTQIAMTGKDIGMETLHDPEGHKGRSGHHRDSMDSDAGVDSADEEANIVQMDSPMESRRRTSLRNQLMDEIRHAFDYSQSFWVLFLMTFLLVGVQVPFNSIHGGFLQMRWYHNDPQKAAQIMTVPDLLSAILVLPVGYFVDHYGQKSWLFMLCGLVIGFSHSVLGLLTIPSPVPALMALGISSAIGAIFTSAIPALVQKHQIATAYGISTSAMNLAFTVFPLVVAKLMTVDPTVYTYPEVFFACCGFCGFVLAVRLKCLDTDGSLDRREIDNA